MDPATVAVLSTALAAVVGGIVALVRIAVNSANRRADDWREIAKISRAAGDVTAASLDRLVPTVTTLAATQREAVALLQQLAAQSERGREAA